jgi:hypothetical protein
MKSGKATLKPRMSGAVIGLGRFLTLAIPTYRLVRPRRPRDQQWLSGP